MVKVSVIMAVYNEEKYVKQAVDSILNQTFADFEFIIIDDGSTDNTLSILNSYDDNRMKIIACERKGVVYCRNECISVSTGKYIAIMDGDDVSMPKRLEKQVKFLDENTDYVAVGCFITRTDDVGNPVKQWKFPLETKEPIFNFNFKQPNIGHACSLIRLDGLKKIKGYREYFYGSEDADLLLRLEENGKLGSIQESLYLYRFNDGNITLSLNVYRRILSDVAAGFCAKLRRSGKSDAIFDNKQLSQKDGFLLHKTDLSILQCALALYLTWYYSFKTLAILILRKILRKK